MDMGSDPSLTTPIFYPIATKGFKGLIHVTLGLYWCFSCLWNRAVYASGGDIAVHQLFHCQDGGKGKRDSCPSVHDTASMVMSLLLLAFIPCH